MSDLSASAYVNYPQVKLVESFEALVATPFAKGVNALCWPRDLSGDFDEIVAQVGATSEIVSLDAARLRALPLSVAGARARTELIEDLRLLTQCELSPSLDCIPVYPRDDGAGPFPTDVYSYHVDSAPVIADTYLCSYTVAASEGLANADAERWADVPSMHDVLWVEYGGSDEREFQHFLTENYYDLHYRAKPGAKPFGFGLGNFWRIANACPGSPVLPCIHRAPVTASGAPPRLLLIS